MAQSESQFGRHDVIDPAGVDGGTLVVVFLRGGADGLTLVPPVNDDVYRNARPLLGVGAGDVMMLDDYFGLHKDLGPLHAYFEAGRMAITHGAGSEDMTRSHFEAQDLMEHGGALGSGWLGRYMRARGGEGGSFGATSAVAIGATRPESLRGAPAGAVMQTVREFAFEEKDDAFVGRLNRMYQAQATPLGQAGQNTLAAVEKLKVLRSTNEAAANNAEYPKTNFARGLREIAKLIKTDVGLVASTIDLPNWDTHYVQEAGISSKMQDLAGSLHAFLTDLNQHPGGRKAGGNGHGVTVVVMTEFGRRLKENTSFGTDHGAGSAMFLLGQGVDELKNAGKVESSFRDLSVGPLDELGDPRASINYRDVLAPVLLGHSPGVDLGAVFPGYDFQAMQS